MSDDILDFEGDELEEFIQKYMQLDRKVQQPDGIFSILPGSREKQYQNTLKYFLNPQEPHGFGYTLLGTFLHCIDFHEFNLTGQHIEIDDEVWIGDDSSEGRIDLVIYGGNALADHPRWAVFLELKVGADEGDRQAWRYATADKWAFSWFDTSEVTTDQLDDKKYVYLKRADADGPADGTGTFDVISWSELVESFQAEISDSLFEYPNRSVIQFTDFIQSLKETERMTSEINEDELNERLNLYFEHDRLIRQVEQANSQFESDFKDVSTYLTDNWESEIAENTISKIPAGKHRQVVTRSGRASSRSTGTKIRSTGQVPSNSTSDIHQPPSPSGTKDSHSGFASRQRGTFTQRSCTTGNRSTTCLPRNARQTAMGDSVMHSKQSA